MKNFLFLFSELYTDEHHRARRQANSVNNTRKAKTTATMIKEMHKLLSEGRQRLCTPKSNACPLGPPGPPGHQGRKEKRETEDEKGRREVEDHQEKGVSKAPWDLQGQKVT